MRLPGRVSMRRCVASTTRTTCDRRRWVFITLDSGNRARPVDRSARLSWVSIVSRKFCRRWDRSATLPRLGRTLARALRAWATAIAADDFDLRMLPKPFGCPGGCAILQHVDDLALLEVNDDSPVSATLSPAPIVDACHPYRRPRAETGDLPFQMPQNGVVAFGMPGRTSSAVLPTGHQCRGRKEMNKFSDSLGSTSVRTDNFQQLIRKCLTLALPVQTSPTAHLHLHHHGGALHGEILKMTEVSAVPTCRQRAASGTGFLPVLPQRSPNDRRLARP